MPQTSDNIWRPQTTTSGGRDLTSPTGGPSSAGGDPMITPSSSPSHDGLIGDPSSTIDNTSPAPPPPIQSHALPAGGPTSPARDAAPQNPQAGSTIPLPTYAVRSWIRESNTNSFFVLGEPTQRDHIPLTTSPPFDTSSPGEEPGEISPPSTSSSLKVEPGDTSAPPGITSISGPPGPPQSPWSQESTLLYIGQANPLLSDQYSLAQSIDYSEE